MKILIDADGCPVTGIVVRIARQPNTQHTMSLWRHFNSAGSFFMLE